MTQELQQTEALKPVAVRKNEGEARWWFGLLAELKAPVRTLDSTRARAANGQQTGSKRLESAPLNHAEAQPR